MKKIFKIKGNAVEIEVKDLLTISEQLAIQTELQNMIVSREFGYFERMIEPLFKALILKHTTQLDMRIEYEDLLDFLSDNDAVVTEIIDIIDPLKEIKNGCLKAIDFRRQNYTGLMIYDLITVLNPVSSFVNQITADNIVSDEMVKELSKIIDGIKDLDTVEVAKYLTKARDTDVNSEG